jgi:hypothetical protein
MTFIAFHPCEKCGSRDNLAEYENGYFCFGCGWKKPKRNLSRFNAIKPSRVYDGITLDKTLARDHLKWILGYNLTPKEMQHFASCHSRMVKGIEMPCNLLIFLNTQNYWCGRNFDAGVKYLSSGVKPYVEFRSENSMNTLVFVEDVISAVKVSRVAVGVPILGAIVPNAFWQRAREYSKVILWGDRDKARENIVQSKRASEILGKPVQNIITENDPKKYDTEFILTRINN